MDKLVVFTYREYQEWDNTYEPLDQVLGDFSSQDYSRGWGYTPEEALLYAPDKATVVRVTLEGLHPCNP